jgi:hypothetical protein
MGRIERNTWFERLLELQAGYGLWTDDTEAVLSIDDAIVYAEAVLTAASDEEAWQAEMDDALAADGETLTDVQTGSAARDGADEPPRFGRFFHLPGHPFGSEPD